ncbi:MAG: hypothetical protein M3409_07080, partial [Gemmatimonadota bacterium]|nr:hypothetical protein [Gemmatimonadota bacterium]
MRRSLGGFAAAVGLLLLPLPALAQRPIPRAPPPDTLRSDTAAADTAARPLAPPDTLLQQLLRLPGYTATEYGGDSAVFRRADETLRLRGNAEVVRTPERLTADSIVYFRREERVEARGSPRVTGGAQEFEGEVLLYDLARRRATVLGGRTEFAQGANWRITGDLTAAEEGERFYAADTRLTTDDRPEPQYHFRVGRVLVVRDRILVGRPAWLYFGDVPVFPLPFVFQNLEQGRASGILTPRFGINDIVRTGRTSRQISDVGYYWAINQYLGAQASVDWRSGSYTALQGGVDFRWTRQFLNGSFSYRQFFRDEGGTERSMSGNGSWRPDERTNLAASGSYASSSAFVRRESVDPLETVRNLTSNFAADRGFDWGRVSLGATRAQQVGTGRVESTFPSLGISVNPVTLFEDPLAQRARWYNNVTISGLGPTLVRTVVQQPDLVIAPGDTAPLGPFPQDREQLSVRVGPSIRAGDLQLGTNFQLNRETLEQLLGAGLFEDVPRIDRDRGSWNASLSYQQTLIGSTTLSPTLQLGQELVRDTSTDGRYLLGPRRTSFGASVNTDLYGFYPGFGPYSAFRHHFKPGFSYAYEPEVTQTAEQLRAFGPAGGRARNIVRLLNLTNTFEAKLRALQTPLGAAAAAGDTVAVG